MGRAIMSKAGDTRSDLVRRLMDLCVGLGPSATIDVIGYGMRIQNKFPLTSASPEGAEDPRHDRSSLGYRRRKDFASPL